MVFALTKETAGKLGGIVGSDSFQKEYLTIVGGIPSEGKGLLEDYLVHDARKNMTSVASPKEKDAKIATLSYETLEQIENTALLRVLLHTGRTHQIRVQFSSRGMPILGDGKYGSRERHEIALWSYRLSFVHPITKKRLIYHAIPEMVSPWDRFSAYGILK
jgi:23S rRNA pseudouridine1911/1915/1917 synthase